MHKQCACYLMYSPRPLCFRWFSRCERTCTPPPPPLPPHSSLCCQSLSLLSGQIMFQFFFSSPCFILIDNLPTFPRPCKMHVACPTRRSKRSLHGEANRHVPFKIFSLIVWRRLRAAWMTSRYHRLCSHSCFLDLNFFQLWLCLHALCCCCKHSPGIAAAVRSHLPLLPQSKSLLSARSDCSGQEEPPRESHGSLSKSSRKVAALVDLLWP